MTLPGRGFMLIENSYKKPSTASTTTAPPSPPPVFRPPGLKSKELLHRAHREDAEIHREELFENKNKSKRGRTFTQRSAILK